MARVLVTGGAGFIGSHVVDALLARGDEVRILDVLHPAAHDLAPTLAPGSLQRVREMAALREQGVGLDEIAWRYGVSRERVRQILRVHGQWR